jgi:uncharacterized protein
LVGSQYPQNIKINMLAKPTLEERYSNKAIHKLLRNNHPVYAIGQKLGMVNGVEIQTGFPYCANIDTVTLYINPQIQQQYYTYIIALQPKRILFNPGTENAELLQMAQEHGIYCQEACTLVLLASYQY